MITRVTTMTMMHSSSRNLQLAASQLAQSQERASGFRAITKPSDDPAATVGAMNVRSAQRATEQYGRNIQDGNGWLSAVDGALSSTTKLMQRVRDLTLQGANDGAMSPTQKEAIAAELESVRELLLTEANTSYLGRSVFAGNSDAGHAFAADYSFTGGQGAVERRIGDGATVRVDVDGAAAFGQGPSSVFATIDAIVADLRGGTNVGGHVAAIDVHREHISRAHAEAGARHGTVLEAASANLTSAVALEATRSSIEDLDIGQTAIELKMQEVAYQAALSATARAVRPTLMDFLR
ncbi:flagellar hook-associated protein FlgL [Agromyces sp. NPDC056379]|uniref:flagellar hook-associated protein FlgL n=1 Tax=unclassified Agromyces TaxID=2639701 RepID=UPI0035E06332